MENGNRSYYRDFFVGGETFTAFANDGDTISAQMLDANGNVIATWPAIQYRLNWNGQTSCWVSPFNGTICNAISIDVTWYRSQQCQDGNYSMRFYHNSNIFYEGKFYIAPRIPPSRVPGDSYDPAVISLFPTVIDTNDYNQGDYPAVQYGNFCYTIDSNGHVIRHSTHRCPSGPGPNERIATVRALGCAMFDSAMIIGYHGVVTAPLTLMDYLTKEPDGFDSKGDVNFMAVQRYARSHGVQLSYVGQGANAATAACSKGPALLQVTGAHGPHFVTDIGQDDQKTTFKINDPAGGVGRDLTQYGNTYASTREFQGPEYTFQVNRATIIKLHSPAELLITSPSGQRTGLDPMINVSYQQIPNSSYGDVSFVDPFEGEGDVETKELDLLEPVTGNYPLQVTGTATGTYTLEVYNYNSPDATTPSTVSDMPISAGEVQNFVIGVGGTGSVLSGGFDGGGQRPRDVNHFLSYGNPSSDHVSVPIGTPSYTVLIFYASTVIPSSFSATLGGADATSLFHPTAGGFEAVSIPLQPGRNVLKLSIDGNLPNRVATDSDTLTFLVQ